MKKKRVHTREFLPSPYMKNDISVVQQTSDYKCKRNYEKDVEIDLATSVTFK